MLLMIKRLALGLVTCALSACSHFDGQAHHAPQQERRAMPDIFQPVTPSQQRAIMSGERPDWTETQPVRIPRH